MLSGLYVALVTPFRADGTIDEDGLRRLVAFHVEKGTDGLVPCGTTGENPALTVEEHLSVVRIVAEEARGRLRVFAGAGSNSTDRAIELARGAATAGADGLLVITPYYNKPQPDGLVAHFGAVAEAVRLPIIVYNVPGRTGVNMRPETVERLTRFDNIVAVKEASGDVNQSSEILARCGDRMTVLAGDDALTLPIMAVGGRGVVSVAGNVIPDRMRSMVGAALAGDWDEARRRHLELYDFCQAMFIETNPVPVKFVMNMLGFRVGDVRRPLSALRPESRDRLTRIIAAAGLKPIEAGR